MADILNKDNINKVLVALMAGAIIYLFQMVFDVKHTVIITGEAQEQNKRQWMRISKAEKNIVKNETNIKWLTTLQKRNHGDIK
jgi:TctA family transporter